MANKLHDTCVSGGMLCSESHQQSVWRRCQTAVVLNSTVQSGRFGRDSLLNIISHDIPGLHVKRPETHKQWDPEHWHQICFVYNDVCRGKYRKQIIRWVWKNIFNSICEIPDRVHSQWWYTYSDKNKIRKAFATDELLHKWKYWEARATNI